MSETEKDGTSINEQLTERAKHEGAVVSHDATMNWGRSGGTTITTERGESPIPPSVIGATGLAPEHIGVNPDPNQFSAPVRPDSPAGGNGNWNMDQISGYKIGG